MKLEPVKPTNTSASGEYFTVFCCRCSRTVLSKDVLCDTDSPIWGAYYCKPCAEEVKSSANIPTV